MISVLLRTRNEQEHIGYCLQSIHDTIGRDTEVIIGNNKSTDDTLSIIQMFDFMDIQILDINNYTPGKALNSLVKHSTNSTVLSLSAHCKLLPFTHGVEHAVSSLHGNMACFGKQIPIYRGKRITPRYVWSHFGDDMVTNMHSDIENRHFLHNAFCFYRRDYLRDNPFDETLSGKEDRYWAKDMVDRGDKFLYNPEFKVEHYYTKNGATWKGLG